jgi:hypothetical protein
MLINFTFLWRKFNFVNFHQAIFVPTLVHYGECALCKARKQNPPNDQHRCSVCVLADGNCIYLCMYLRAILCNFQISVDFYYVPVGRVGNFRQKTNSAEDGIDGTKGDFRRNSGCSAEQKHFGIPFRTLPRKRKQLGIPFRGTKIEAYSRNSVPNPSAEEKQLGIPFLGPKIDANSRNSVPNHSAEEKTTRNTTK